MTREQLILAAAEKLFHERSFDGVGVDAIAKEAGIVGSGIYRYFSSKEEILGALIENATDALVARLGEPDPDPRRELHQLVSIHVDFAVNHLRLADIWQREHHNLQTSRRSSLVSRQRSYIDRWATCLDACYPGHSREDLLAAIRALHALMTSDTTRRTDSRAPANLAALLESLALAALDGLTEPAGEQAAS